MRRLELKIPPLIVLLIFGVIIRITPVPFKFSGNSIFVIFSAFLFLFGALISILGVLEFKKLKTTVSPMSPEGSSSLVTKGIYKYTRNPMYVGFLVWLLALSVFSRNPISLPAMFFFVLYMNIFQIIPEENILQERFGEEYFEYKNNVRRWI